MAPLWSRKKRPGTIDRMLSWSRTTIASDCASRLILCDRLGSTPAVQCPAVQVMQKEKKLGRFGFRVRESREGRHQRGARRLDDDAIIGDSTTTQSSCYIARLRVYILTVCLASRVGQTKCRTRLGPRALRGGPIAPGLVHSLNVSSPVVRSRGSLYLSSFFLPTR